MHCRWALLTFLGALAACDARQGEPSRPPVIEKPAPASLSKQQLDDRSQQCAKISREQFRRAWKDGTENTAEGKLTAEFASHYNAKLNTCFYLLAVSSPGTLKKMLFDINGGELYGEY